MWCSRPDAILDKASHVEEVQSSGCQTPRSGHSDLIMEIACSRSATVRTLRQHRPDTLQYFDHNFLLKYRFGQNRCHWKANKKCCNLIVQTTNRNVQKAYRPVGNIKHSDGPPKFEKFQNCYSDTETIDCSEAQVCRLDARTRDSDYD
jgi:hypothetical protein